MLHGVTTHKDRINRSSILHGRDLVPPERADYCHDLLHRIDYHRDDPHPLVSGDVGVDAKSEAYGPKEQPAADEWAYLGVDIVLGGDPVQGNELEGGSSALHFYIQEAEGTIADIQAGGYQLGRLVERGKYLAWERRGYNRGEGC
jgi:hypothetical protein